MKRLLLCLVAALGAVALSAAAPRVQGVFTPAVQSMYALPPPAAKPERTVVYVLFDGFSPAELDAGRPTPHFDQLRREGAWSRQPSAAFGVGIR